ncbi:MAG: flagellar biosynthesis protein FlgE [Hahellaceae bacterium]|nr:flagellar biosynthesis protein FlgE [Hahellaceae bacterium]
MISGALQSGLGGIQEGMRRMEKAAGEIARAAQPTNAENPEQKSGDLAEPLVELKLYENNVKASAKVVKTADEVLGTLLDIKA